MPSDVISASPLTSQRGTSDGLAALIRATNFTVRAATVVGYGNMGREYVKALQALGVAQIHVCSRSEAPLAPLRGLDGMTTTAGGFRRMTRQPQRDELAIIGVPIPDLVEASRYCADAGYRHLLIEKPVSLWSTELDALAEELERRQVDALVAYNRMAYPAFVEAQARTREEGGVTSCTYTCTEWLDRIAQTRNTPEELRRWGIGNSLHVMSLAHGLIGLPRTWHGERAGSLAWHPSGTVFVGAGTTERDVPFTYHADWGSTGRWSVEAHTRVSSYRFCPLERLFRRTTPTGDWVEVPLETVAPEIKTGFVEQVAAMLDPGVRRHVPLISLRDAAQLARYGESVFGYTDRP